MLTKDYLNSILEYRDGNLYCRVSRGAAKAGKQVGYKRKDGASNVCVDKKLYLLHRIVFLMHHGYLPDMVDHIDGNRANNRIENLREATHSQNACNANARFDNKVGIKNITYYKANNTYVVRVRVNNDRKYIGSFDDLELAELVAIEARNKYHKEFARHGEYNV
jgi:uncharacterized protein YkuJ